MSRHISVGIATGLWAGRSGFEPLLGKEFFLFSITCRLPLRPTQVTIQWVPRAPSQEVERQKREAYLSPPSSAKIKNCVTPLLAALICHIESYVA
jgi:hypothetical protein